MVEPLESVAGDLLKRGEAAVDPAGFGALLLLRPQPLGVSMPRTSWARARKQRSGSITRAPCGNAAGESSIHPQESEEEKKSRQREVRLAQPSRARP